VCRNNLSSKSIRNISIPAFVTIGIFAILHFFTIIPAGHIGVIDLFGVVSKRTLPAGINWVNPFAGVTQFPLRPEESNEKMQVFSCEELTIEMKISVLYPTERDRSDMAIQEEIAGAIATRGVIIETQLPQNVALPLLLAEAIVQKQKADQESRRMEFILTKEKHEANRKRIETKGATSFKSKENMMNSHGLEEAHASNPDDIRICDGCAYHAVAQSGSFTLAIYEGDPITFSMITSSLYGTGEQSLSKFKEE